MRRMRWLLPALFLSVTTPTLTIAAQQATSAQRAVLVTGASSGIGRRITETLAKQGLFVYALSLIHI